MSRSQLARITVWPILGLIALFSFGSVVAAGPPGDAGPPADAGLATHIVVFHDGVDPDQASEDLAQAHGLTREFVYRHAIAGASFIVPPGKADDVASDPRVAFIERNQRVSIVAQEVPTGVQRIFADENSNITIDGNDDYRVDVDVAVIDTGIDLDHPDLNVVASTDCARGGPFGGDCKDGGGDDGNGHGSHVAGTIAALDNGIGVVGVAPGARLLAVRVLGNDGSGWMSWVIAGVDWVTGHASEIEVANMSLGCECESDALDTAITNSVAAGVVYAVAAGNSDKDASTFSPANHPDVITVSALADFDGEPGGLASPTCRSDEDDTLANFSNWGNLIEITAPGVCILSTYKDGGYATFSGTSMASPHTAGAAALLASGSNAPTDKTGVDAIVQTLLDNGNFNWTDDSGDGVQEPLLDVSNTTVFAPATVAGSSPPSEPDTTAPVISNVAAGNITDTSADITWDTDEASDSVVNYGTTTALGSTGSVADLVTSHLVGLSGLTAETTYYYEVQSTDSSGNTATDDNNGSYYTFTTAAAPAEATTVSVKSITYTTWAGKNKDKHLNVTVALEDDLGNPVAGASVSIKLDFDKDDDGTVDQSWTGTGTTDSDGKVTFSLKNAPSGGCYVTTVTDVAADGLTWDPSDPANTSTKFCK